MIVAVLFWRKERERRERVRVILLLVCQKPSQSISSSLEPWHCRSRPPSTAFLFIFFQADCWIACAMVTFSQDIYYKCCQLQYENWISAVSVCGPKGNHTYITQQFIKCLDLSYLRQRGSSDIRYEVDVLDLDFTNISYET